jgi:hypothetical protein
MTHRLPPFLREAFGGSTGLVYFGEGRTAHDQALLPHDDPPLLRFDAGGASYRPSILVDHGKDNPVSEIEDFPDLEVQVLENSVPVLKTLANRSSPLKRLANPPTVPRSVTGEEAHYRIEITARSTPESSLRHLHQVVGPGLHRAAKYHGPLLLELKRASGRSNTLALMVRDERKGPGPLVATLSTPVRCAALGVRRLYEKLHA